MNINEITKRLSELSEEDRAALLAEAHKATAGQIWVPNPGPQTAAYESLADELFYGGSAGGGKTGLALGLALTRHSRSLILRRTHKEANGLVEALADIIGTRDGYNSQTGSWKLGKRVIDIGGCQLEEDKQKYKGSPHDLIVFDEASDFTETQYRFIMTWNRSTIPGQRCRVVAAGNPPTRPEGLWVVKRWAAWLDPQHPNPAEPGELRWYIMNDAGVEEEVDGPGPYMVGGVAVPARSRTFIPARLSDNPELAGTGYDAVLANLPPELRAAYRDGDFGVVRADDAFQAIPTAWVKAAQARWTANAPVGVPMCAMGVDPAQGGADNTVIAMRRGEWYAPLLVVPGVSTPTGLDVAGLVIANRRDGARVTVDIGGGWGGTAFAHLRENGVDATAYMGVKKSSARTVDNALKFTNIRTETYWRFREALDPTRVGNPVALPPSATLLADLCAPRYSVGPRGLELESKEDVVKRLGRSPDEGDAVVMAWSVGLRTENVKGGKWEDRRAPTGQAIMSTKYRRY